MPFKLHVLPAGPIETNAYLLTDAARGEAVLIDAPDEVWAQVQPILQSEGCKLTALWITHGHWDHMQGAAEVASTSGAPVLAHPDDRVLLETPGVMETVLPPSIRLAPVPVARWLAHGEKISGVGLSWEVRHVPGHCPGNVLFWNAAAGVAFVGDAIFRRSIGRTDLPQGDHELLLKSIREQIYTLPDGTILCPGHGDETTVASEKAGNPYVRG